MQGHLAIRSQPCKKRLRAHDRDSSTRLSSHSSLRKALIDDRAVGVLHDITHAHWDEEQQLSWKFHLYSLQNSGPVFPTSGGISSFRENEPLTFPFAGLKNWKFMPWFDCYQSSLRGKASLRSRAEVSVKLADLFWVQTCSHPRMTSLSRNNVNP